MLPDYERELNKYLLKIAENLDITDAMRKKAVESYTVVGRWLGDCSDDAEVKIMPQGSFNLGTMIKPITDKDEYDIDLVCLLKDHSTAQEHDIKNIVGDRLKENARYVKMLKKEGKRCWTLHYEEFHMDILPCVPKDALYIEPNQTVIRLTHKNENQSYESKYSNPYGYQKWFEKKMEIQLNEFRKALAFEKKASDITKIPLYVTITPLQRAIQLLKRHRDITYNKYPHRKEEAPISIIITTLAAKAYNNEDSVFEALSSILIDVDKYIDKQGEEYWIQNPVANEENFADKWNSEPQKAKEFFNWVNIARKELLSVSEQEKGIRVLQENLQTGFGDSIVRKSFVDIATEVRNARDKDELYVEKKTGRLTSEKNDKTTRIGGHTFFGK